MLGLVLLARGGNNSLLSTGSSNASGTPPRPRAGADRAERDHHPPPATNKPAASPFAVFNGTGGKDPNAAGNSKAKLTPLGYAQVTIADRTATPKSAVYYSVARQGDAVAVATALGLPRSAVNSSTNAASLPPGAQGASVIVVIGEDSAAGTTP